MYKYSGLTLIELIIVVVILGVLALIAAPGLLSASNYAKEGAVKANTSAAASTVLTHLTVEGKDADDAAEDATEQLNAANTFDDPDDDPTSPYDKDSPAFIAAETPDAGGQVTIYGEDEEYTVLLKGWNQAADDIIILKTVSAFDENDL